MLVTRTPTRAAGSRRSAISSRTRRTLYGVLTAIDSAGIRNICCCGPLAAACIHDAVLSPFAGYSRGSMLLIAIDSRFVQPAAWPDRGRNGSELWRSGNCGETMAVTRHTVRLWSWKRQGAVDFDISYGVRSLVMIHRHAALLVKPCVSRN
jgi:hypothetical protein